jgi:predicted DNA repair protein MutK
VKEDERTGQALEDHRVASAIRTDFILSAEIMAISLAGLSAQSSTWERAVILAIVGIGMTVLVYGVVALIVKADDAGVAMAQSGNASAVRALGRGVVTGMPPFLKALSVVGMLAMLWVGGGIVLHGLGEFGWKGPAEWIHHAALATGGGLAVAVWFVEATLSGIVGLAIGAVVDVVLLRGLVKRS